MRVALVTAPVPVTGTNLNINEIFKHMYTEDKLSDNSIDLHLRDLLTYFGSTAWPRPPACGTHCGTHSRLTSETDNPGNTYNRYILNT